MAGVHDLILQFPQGYDTQIGDAGSGLSGGQKQRIGLARALYGDPALVVLDEPNSNLDDAGEASLSRAIIAMRQAGKTVIIISHRPSILQTTNKLLLLRDGMVHAFGPTDQVLKALAQAQAQAQGTTTSPVTAPQPPAPPPSESTQTDQAQAEESVLEAKVVGALPDTQDGTNETSQATPDEDR